MNPPPLRQPVCAHDVRGSFRQACSCCGACDHVDFRVTDEAWADVVPADLDGTHVCLRCFDALAAEAGVNYAESLTELHFVGDAAVFRFLPDWALSA